MLADDRTTTTIDRDTFTITFHRTFGTPRELVFEAWTRPEHVVHWWDPSGVRLEECAIDLRVGGRFKFVNAGSHHSPPFEGEYTTIEPPTELRFLAMGATGTVRLEVAGAGTSMTVSIRCANAEHLAKFVELGVAEGTARTLDNLVAHLSR